MANMMDVARRAGVSLGTVSRYLNGAQVKEGNKKRIDEAISALHFKINPIARTLKTNKTNLIGVMIRDLGDIYSASIAKSLEDELYRNNYNMIVCSSTGSRNTGLRKLEILLDRMVDGLIIYPTRDTLDQLRLVSERHIPFVTVDTKVQGFECDQVLTDNTDATRTAAEWLLSRGHRKIGLINGNLSSFTAGERHLGYMLALKNYGIAADAQYIVERDYTEESGYDGLKYLMGLSEPPTAVLTCNYYTTLGAVKASYDLGVKIPQDLSLIGFDNIGISDIARPSLSIVVQPMQEIGATAARLLLKRIRGDTSGFPALIRLKTTLLLKDSAAGITGGCV